MECMRRVAGPSQKDYRARNAQHAPLLAVTDLLLPLDLPERTFAPSQSGYHRNSCCRLHISWAGQEDFVLPGVVTNSRFNFFRKQGGEKEHRERS